MQQHPGFPYRCTVHDDAACQWPGIRQASSGVKGITLLIETFRCKTVSLYGFANEDLTLPYHYWRDGSNHDGVTSAKWYASRVKLRTHDFAQEHKLMHDVLGGCSWVVSAERYHAACRSQFEPPATPCASLTSNTKKKHVESSAATPTPSVA